MAELKASFYSEESLIDLQAASNVFYGRKK